MNKHVADLPSQIAGAVKTAHPELVREVSKTVGQGNPSAASKEDVREKSEHSKIVLKFEISKRNYRKVVEMFYFVH